MAELTLTGQNFEQEVLLAKEPVLVIIQARRWIEARMQEAGFIC